MYTITIKLYAYISRTITFAFLGSKKVTTLREHMLHTESKEAAMNDNVRIWKEAAVE
jgi:hypothetical protein